jgi:membrane protein required for colicin V production
MTLNWLDWIIGITLAVNIVRGLMRGFTRQIIGFAATLLGLLGGLWFYESAAALLQPHLKSEPLARFLGFILIFAGVNIVGAIIISVMNRIYKATGLSWVDRLLGGGFGVLKTVLVAIALVLALTAFPFQPVRDSIAESFFAPYVLEAARTLAALAPPELKDGFKRGYDEVKRIWEGLPVEIPGADPAKEEPQKPVTGSA